MTDIVGSGEASNLNRQVTYTSETWQFRVFTKAKVEMGYKSESFFVFGVYVVCANLICCIYQLNILYPVLSLCCLTFNVSVSELFVVLLFCKLV